VVRISAVSGLFRPIPTTPPTLSKKEDSRGKTTWAVSEWKSSENLKMREFRRMGKWSQGMVGGLVVIHNFWQFCAEKEVTTDS
jgi:hypothetical protein